jgi:serine/threonine protein kinase
MNKPVADLPSPSDILNWLVDNQFLTESLVRSYRVNTSACADSMVLAKQLLQQNLLTPYQVNQLLQGKKERLLMGPYRVVERLGEGAMGQVLKCWSPKLQLHVAVKMIHKEHLVSKKALNRFFREMETAGKLDHPNIVLLRDADRIGDCPYMVMEFVEGTDLSRLVKQARPLTIRQAADFARQTALGLQHAFERGVVHRDIKPGNLLVTRDPQPIVKISDFGLARLESERSSERRLTQYGTVLGTIDYIAPEQAENAQNADIRSDIYSLGCTLYFLLTGKPPFSGTTVTEKMSARLHGDPADVRMYRPEIPPGIIAILKRTITRQPADRYQSPRDVAQALAPFCRATAIQESIAEPPARAVTRDIGIGARNPFTFDNSAVTPAAAITALTSDETRSSGGHRTQRKSARLLLAGSAVGGITLLILLLPLLRGCGTAPPADVYPSDASLAVTLKEHERTMNPGDRKIVVMSIKRTKYQGPVQVSLENLPDGVSAFPSKIIIDANKDHGELALVVYQFAKRATVRIRARAVAKNLHAEDWLQLTVAGP